MSPSSAGTRLQDYPISHPPIALTPGAKGKSETRREAPYHTRDKRPRTVSRLLEHEPLGGCL